MALNKVSMDSLNRFTCLVIGQSGIGKTSLLRTIPADDKVMLLSAEAGLLGVKDIIDQKHIEAYEIKSFKEIVNNYNEVAESDAQWVFIDSLTEISSLCVEHVKQKYPSKSDSFAMWGVYNDSMQSLIKSYRDLDSKTVVFTCLHQSEYDDLNRRFIGPAISGSQIKERLTSFFDEVLYMDYYKDGDKQYRVFYTQPVNNFPAKDRSGKLNIIEEPNLATIKNKILEVK